MSMFNKGYTIKGAELDAFKAARLANEALTKAKTDPTKASDLKNLEAAAATAEETLEKDEAAQKEASQPVVLTAVIVGCVFAALAGAFLGVFMFVPALAATPVALFLLGLGLNPIVLIAVTVVSALLVSALVTALVKSIASDNVFHVDMSTEEYTQTINEVKKQQKA
ncbi:MAG: hypothetical protein LBI69_04220 [Puniceicoccales bacterium]|jgi:hypothetical protein|nr:hypothetical protein [Puniceicoccales bacterium]